MFTVTRVEHNPILSPLKEHPWEAAAAFNGCPIVHKRKTYLFYRTLSEPQLLKSPHIPMSSIGKAISTDNEHYTDRTVFISPDHDFDQFGCEDPRVTKLGDTFYIFYTALGSFPFTSDSIRVAVARSRDLETVDDKHLVTPFNAKAMTMFPEKINGKISTLLTISTEHPPSEICYAEFNTPEEMWSSEYWQRWHENLDAHKIQIRRQHDDQIELGTPPIKTDAGWLVLYAHIQKYGSGNPVFGIEAMLLDLKNPRQVVGRTKGPFMVPDSYYEHAGHAAQVVFPTGALVRGKTLELHYGAADTHCAIATIPLDNLIKSMTDSRHSYIKRFPGNPIIVPRDGVAWEAGGTLNPAAIDLDGSVHILYRAVSDKNISTIGYARSQDGFSIDERSDMPMYAPRTEFEKNGCEDARIVQIEKHLYMTYTAYDGITPRVAISSISVADFLKHRWDQWSLPEVITPPAIGNKDAAVLPEKINGKYMLFHRVGESICADFVATLDFSVEKIKECIEILGPRHGMWDGGKVGLAAPPIKTKAGWLLLYHGVSSSTTYRVGAALLDLENPTVIKARTAVPIFEPEEEYEHKGVVPNVVFPCGLTVRGRTLYMYYGAADSVVAVATVSLAAVLQMLET